MPGFTLNKLINSHRLWLVVLAVLWLASLPEAAAQVLTLNSRDCVKVETKFSELVPHHKYQNPPNMLANDVIPIDEDGKPIPYEKWMKRKPDTTSTYMEDEITIFYIWHKNEVLRVMTRKEKDSSKVEELDHSISLSLQSLSGKNVHQAHFLLNQFQKSDCPFINSPHFYINDMNCGILAYSNNSQKADYYKVFNITGYSIEHSLNVNNINVASIKPNYMFYRFWSAGLDIDVIDEIYNTKPKLENWITKFKNYFYELFDINIKSKSSKGKWFYVLKRMYENVFFTFKKYEASQPIPYLTSQQLENWPRYFLFPFNREAQKQFTPLYSRSRVKGYYFYDENLHPETKGYVVVPGKFFLPRRLQIVSVNDVPWQE